MRQYRGSFTLALPVLFLCDLNSEAVSIPGWLWFVIILLSCLKFTYTRTTY
jgi:hypothetical protein